MGSLSKLDDFLFNPQGPTCCVVQGASRNVNSDNREIHGVRSSNDPYPEGGYFPHHSGQLKSSAADMVTEPYPHSLFIWGVFDFEKIQNESHLFCVKNFAVLQDMPVHSFDIRVKLSIPTYCPPSFSSPF